MESVAVKAKRLRRPAVRAGRPPRKLAGAVDERILDAARRVFLDEGLGGASIDAIARLARAGKPTIYARFPTKEALFAAVAMRNATNVRAGLENFTPTGNTLEERLASIAREVLKRLMSSDALEFMRLALTEARRFPDLGKIGGMIRQRGAQVVSQMLSETAQTHAIGSYPAFRPERLEKTTQFFLDLVIQRILNRALFGENPAALWAEADAHISERVAFFLAACRCS
jgi:AcrR family transcriptional regulator